MDKILIANIMKRYFSRPSSTHTDSPVEVKWIGNVPTINRDHIQKVIGNEDILYRLYQEIVRRENRDNYNVY